MGPTASSKPRFIGFTKIFKDLGAQSAFNACHSMMVSIFEPI
jgi:hypothetical protein